MFKKLINIGLDFIKFSTKEKDIQDDSIESAEESAEESGENYRYVPRNFGNINDYQYINQFLDGKYSNSNTTKHLILYGDTGLGKTEIAKYYYYENKRKDVYGEIIWFDCEHESFVKQRYENIANTLSIPTTANVAKEVLLTLVEKANNCNKRTLLIFDDVKNLSLLLKNRLIPRFGNFDVLITTQQLETINDLHSIKQEIKKMNEDQVKRLIKEYLKNEVLDDEDLKKFYELSHGIPADIVKAFDYIIDNRSSLKEFIEWHVHKQFTSFDKEIFKSIFLVKYAKWKNLVNALDVRSRDLLARICFFPGDIKNEWLYSIYSNDYLLIKGNLSKGYLISESETKCGYITIDEHLKKYLIDDLFVNARQVYIKKTLDLLSLLHENLLKNGYLEQDLYEILTLAYALLNDLSDNEFKKYRGIYFPLFISCVLSSFDIHNLDSYYKFLTKLDISTENKSIHEKLIIKCLIADYKRINQRNLEQKNKQNNELLKEAKKEFSNIRLSILIGLHNQGITRLSIIFYFLRGITYIDDAEFDKGLSDLKYAFKQMKGQNNVPESIILKAKFYMALALIAIPTIEHDDIKIYINDFSIRLDNINNNQKGVFEFACLNYLISILYMKLGNIEQFKEFYTIFVSHLKGTRGFLFERLTRQIKIPNTIEELLDQDVKSLTNYSYATALGDKIILEQKQYEAPLLNQAQDIKNINCSLNQAVQLFLGDGKTNPSHLEFNTWYHPEVCHYLLQLIPNQAQLIRVIFHDTGDGNNTTTFKKQLQELILLSNRLDKPAIFIGKEPGAENHFIAGIIKNRQLLFINPLGSAQHSDCYQTFTELVSKKVLNGLWFSNNILQHQDYEEKGLVSCGVLVLELTMHVLSTFTADSFNTFWEQLTINQPKHHVSSNLLYHEMNIQSLLPESLKDAQTATTSIIYKNLLLTIRDSHYQLLQTLPIDLAKGMSVNEFLQKCKNEAPIQVLFNALVFETQTILTINQMTEYKLLISELDIASDNNIYQDQRVEDVQSTYISSQSYNQANKNENQRNLISLDTVNNQFIKIDQTQANNKVKEEFKICLKVSTQTKYNDMLDALNYLNLFNVDINDKQYLWKKPLEEITADECSLLYELASEFFTFDIEGMQLDKHIHDCLDEEQKLLFSYAQFWLPEYIILHNNIAILEVLLKYHQKIRLGSSRLDKLLDLALSSKINGDGDDIAILLLNAGACLNFEKIKFFVVNSDIDDKYALYQVQLPIPSSIVWDKKNELPSLTKEISLRFYKKGYHPPHQTLASAYISIVFKQSSLTETGKERMAMQLQGKLNDCFKPYNVALIENKNDAELNKETLSFDDVLNLGKAQRALLDQTIEIITTHKLIDLITIADFNNSPTVEFIQHLNDEQLLGFIKLGAWYENIFGLNSCTHDQDRVFYLLNEEQKCIVKYAQYWNLRNLCRQQNIDNASFLTVEQILTAIKNKDVDIDINAINSYGLTCLDQAIKATQGIDSKTGLHIRNNGKLCLLLLKHGAKANKSIDDLIFSPSKYSEYRASLSNAGNTNAVVNLISVSQSEKAGKLYNQILQKGVDVMAESRNNVQGSHEVNKLPLLQQEIIANKFPVELFRYLSGQGYTWRHLLNTHVFDLNLTAETRKTSEAIVKELITKRNALDQELYYEAIQSLLGDYNKPSESQRYFYNHLPENTGPRSDLMGYKLEYYIFDILDKNQNNKRVFTVKIIAPGSRDLTSDIDTTVEINCHQPDLLPQLNWPDALSALNIQEVDPELVLQAGIVYHFNQLNCEKLGQTSAESRDSNVYVDGFMHALAFPKFDDLVWQDENQKEKSAIQEISKKTKQSFYQAQKHQRNVLELAASLLPLRAYYKDKSEEFIRQLKDLFAIHPLGKPNQASFDTLMQEVIAKTDTLYQYQQTQVNTFKNDHAIQAQYIASCSKGLGIALSQASLNHERIEDFDAYVNNLLYAKHLLTVAIIRKKIKTIARELSDEKIALTSLQVELQKFEENLRAIKQKIAVETDELIKSAFDLKRQEIERSHINLHNNSFKPKLKNYVTNLETFANLQIEQQKALIDAQLFALEAYINYSAPYHIVKWQQSGDDNTRIDRRRVALCSALQQIGFQLLHAQHYQRLGMESGQILYRVAKYGQRVADIFFGDATHWFGDTEQPYHETEIILQRFKAEITAKIFGENLYDLLNLQIALVKDIKKNEDIPVHEKGHQAILLCLKRYMKDYKNSSVDKLEDDILDAILSKEKMGLGDWLKVKDTVLIHTMGKLIVEAYRAKTNNYLQTSDNQLCWGTLFKATGNSAQYHMLSKNSDKGVPVKKL